LQVASTRERKSLLLDFPFLTKKKLSLRKWFVGGGPSKGKRVPLRNSLLRGEELPFREGALLARTPSGASLSLFVGKKLPRDPSFG